MSFNNPNYAAPAASPENIRGPHPRGPKIVTTMKDFIILSKIGTCPSLCRAKRLTNCLYIRWRRLLWGLQGQKKQRQYDLCPQKGKFFWSRDVPLYMRKWRLTNYFSRWKWESYPSKRRKTRSMKCASSPPSSKCQPCAHLRMQTQALAVLRRSASRIHYYLYLGSLNRASSYL